MAIDEEYVVLLALQARDTASQTLLQVDGLLNRLAGTSAGTRAAIDGMSSSMKTLGVVGLGVAVGVAGIFGAAEHAAVSYQDALSTVQINAHLTGDAADAMGHSISLAAIGTRSSAEDMLTALGPVAGELATVQGGALDTAGAVQALAAASNLSESSQVDLGTSLKAITDLLLVYHLHASDAASVSTTLFDAHAQLGVGVGQLATILQRLQPRLAGSGLDMEHLLGIVKEMQPAAGTGARGLLMVGMILQRLQVPSAGARKMFDALGVSLTDANGKFVGAEGAIETLRKAYEKLPTAIGQSASGQALAAKEARLATLAHENQTKGIKAQEKALQAEIKTLQASGAGLTQATFLQTIFGSQASLAAQLIAGGAAGIEKNTAALKANGSAADAAALKQQDAAAQMAMIPKTLGDIATQIGLVILPALNRVLTPLVGFLTRLATYATMHPDIVTASLAIAGALGLLAGALVFLRPALSAVRAEVFLFANPFVLVGGLLAGLILAMRQVPDVMGPVNNLFRVLAGAVGAVAPFFETFVGSIMNLIGSKGTIADVGTAFTGLVNEVKSVLPVILTALQGVAAAIVGWIGPAIPRLIEGLEGLLGQILQWIIDTIPRLADQLVAWAKVFWDWVGQTLRGLLGALETFIGPVLDWIQREVPLIASALVNWTTAFVTWVTGQALPAFLGALGGLIAGFAAWLIGSDTAGQIANALATWTLQFLAWATDVGIPAAANLIGGLVSELISLAPEILGGLAILAAQVVGGLADAILSDPGRFARAMFALLTGAVVLAAISAAGGVAGAAYAGTAEIVGTLMDKVVEGWHAVMERGVGSVIDAGTRHGIIYSLTVSAMDFLSDKLKALWELIGPSEAPVAAAAGAIDGAAYGEAANAAASAVKIAPGQLPLGIGAGFPRAAATGAVEEVPAVGEQLTLGLVPAAGILARIGTLIDGLAEGFLGVLDVAGRFAPQLAIIAAAVTLVVTHIKEFANFFGGVFDLAGSAVNLFLTVATNLGTVLSGVGDTVTGVGNGIGGIVNQIPGLSFIGGLFDGIRQAVSGLLTVVGGLGDVIGNVFGFLGDVGHNIAGAFNNAADDITVAAHRMEAPAVAVRDSWAIEAAAIPGNVSGALSAGAPTVAAGATTMATPISAAVAKQQQDAITAATQTPGDIAAALKSGSDKIDADSAALAKAMKTPMTEAQEKIILNAEMTGQKIPAAMFKGVPKWVADAFTHAEDVGSNLQAGLASTDPQIAAAAGAMSDDIQKQWQTFQDAAHDYGQNTGDAYAAGLGDSAPEVSAAAARMAGAAAAHLRAFSPPGPASPLHDIGVWALRTGQAYAEGLTGAAASVSTAAGDLLAGAANRLSAPSALAGPGAAGGSQNVTVQVYIGNQQLQNLVTKILFDEERRYAGAAQPGSAF